MPRSSRSSRPRVIRCAGGPTAATGTVHPCDDGGAGGGRRALPVPPLRPPLDRRDAHRRDRRPPRRRRHPDHQPELRRAGARIDPAALHERFPQLVVVSITPYGLEGPYADRPATELTLQAESGALSVRGRADRAPVQMGGRTMEWVSGLYAAVAALGAHRVVRGGGPGELVDVSVAEVANTTGTTAADLMDSLRGRPNPGVPGRSFETPSIEPTSDGYVGFNTNTRTQFDSFLLMIERPDLIEGGAWAPIAARVVNWEEWNGIIHEFTTKHTTAEVVALAAELRIPVAPVCDGPAVVEFEQGKARGSIVDDPTGTFRVPTRSWRIERRGRAPAEPRAAPRRAHGHDRAPPAQGRRDPRAHAAAARREGPRPHRVVGGAVGVGHARGAGRRRDPRGVGHPPRRHALHQRREHRSRQLVGLQRALPRLEHQQARSHARPHPPRRSRARAAPDRAVRHGRRELHAAGDRAVRPRLGRRARHQPACGDGADARVRSRRAVARPPGVRADDGAGHRPRVAHRPRRRPTAHPARAVRPERRHARRPRRARRARGARPHRRRVSSWSRRCSRPR